MTNLLRPSLHRPTCTRKRRRAMQLLELVISLATASILMAGVGTAVVISKRTLDSVTLHASSAASAQGGIQLLQNDLREARQIDNRTTTSIELKVPDRNNDGELDSVRYRWSATAGPLETSGDGVTWRAVSPSLSNMQLNWQSREPQSLENITPLDTSGRISYLGMTSNSRSDSARSLTLAAPPGYVAGDACVAILAASSNPGSIKADKNWVKISQVAHEKSLNLAIWYTTDVNGTASFSWGDSAQVIGCIVHLTGNNSEPYVGVASLTGLGQLPAPALGGSHPREFVIRALAGIGPAALMDAPRVVNHSAILLRQVDIESSSSELTLAVVYQPITGSTIDAATFQFTPACLASCTSTVALQP